MAKFIKLHTDQDCNGGGAAIKPLTVKKNGVYEAKAGGVLEYNKEVKFKDVITEADVETYAANATPVDESEEQTIYAVARVSGGGISLMRMATPDPSITVWALMNQANDGFAYFINASAMGTPIPDNCWVDAQTMSPIDGPTITMIEDPQLSADLATTAVFFDVEPVDAYCPVTVDIKANVTPLTATENGVYEPTEGTDGYSTVTVEVPDKPEQEKTVNITANGTTTVTPDDGYAISKVTANVNIPGPVTQTKTVNITENGTSTVAPDSDKVLSEVSITVNVPTLNMNGTTKSGDLSDEASFVLVHNDLRVFGSGAINKSLSDQCADNAADVTKVYLDEGITSTEYGTFVGFNNISEVHTTDLAAWSEIDFGGYGNPFTKAKSFYVNGNLITELTIPEGATKIGRGAFESTSSAYGNTYAGEKITSISIPDSVVSIGEHAFQYNKKASKLWLGKGVRSVGQGAFYGCDELASIYITDLDSFCRLENIDKETDSAHLFDGDSKPTLYLNNEAVRDLVIPDTITACPAGFLDGYTKLTSVSAGANVTVIGKYAFANCIALTEVSMPGLVEVGAYAFKNCRSITSLNLPQLETMGQDSFRDCTALTEFIAPKACITAYGLNQDVNLKKIDIRGCLPEQKLIMGYSLKSLTTLILRSDTVCVPNSGAASALNACHMSGTVDSTYNPEGLKDGYIYVPANLVDAYKAESKWSYYVDQFRAIEDYPEICGT